MLGDALNTCTHSLSDTLFHTYAVDLGACAWNLSTEINNLFPQCCIWEFSMVDGLSIHSPRFFECNLV